MMTARNTDFYKTLARTFNSGQARGVVLCGNVHDLFHDGSDYVPLLPLLCERSKAEGIIRIVYELNGPVRILDDPDHVKTRWISWKTGEDPDTLLLRGLRRRGPSEIDRLGDEFDQLLTEAIGKPTLALELLRQLTVCSRSFAAGRKQLMVFIEAADMLLPAGTGDVASLNDRHLRRISIVHDWFCDPGFLDGGDSVCLIAESRSLIHPRVARLPQVMSVEITPPTLTDRQSFIESYCRPDDRRVSLWGTAADMARFTAGLSLHALRQVLAKAAYTTEPLEPASVMGQVEEFIQSQIGDDVVEFKRPEHRLDDIVGFTRLKQFLRDELIPRFKATPDRALPGAGVAGPIGSGKTFIFEAVAAELDVPVLVLKSIRSQWYGQTDVVFERLRRVLEALDRVVIFVDEADTQFGGVGAETHSTERRLTGKIQAMMSDPRLRGRVVWLLMTARIHLLSPDIRRPGRVGDLIIPILDPEGDDRRAFLRWVLPKTLSPDAATMDRLDVATEGYSPAAFASLRQHLKAKAPNSINAVLTIVEDLIPPDIGLVRRYQTLQALTNCTRRSLLPDPTVTDVDRESWRREIQRLEALGIR